LKGDQFGVRTVVQLYGTPYSAVHSIVELLGYLNFSDHMGERTERLEFVFKSGKFQWSSRPSQIMLRSRKSSINDIDISIETRPLDHLWTYTILPNIIDLIIGRSWEILSMDDFNIGFWKQDGEEYKNGVVIAPLKENEGETPKKRNLVARRSINEAIIDRPVPKGKDKKKKK